jgi:hypothetical protein
MTEAVIRIMEACGWDLTKGQVELKSLGLSRNDIGQVCRQEARMRLKQEIAKNPEAACANPESIKQTLGRLADFVTHDDFEQIMDEVALEKKVREQDWTPKFNW